MRRLRAFAGLILLVATLLNGCNRMQPRPPASDRNEEPAVSVTAIDSPSMQFLPRLGQAPGWRLENDPLVYPAEHLRSYLDAEARYFLLYEVIDVTVGHYARAGAEGFATVQIFRFPDFVKAFGAYSSRRKAVVEILDISNEAFLGPRSIHIWRGPFYVRIIGGGSEGTIDAMKALAGSVVTQMPAAPSRPAVFSFLPDEWRVPHSERFEAEAGLGHPVLKGAFAAEFDLGGQRIDGIVIPAPNKATATRILDELRSFFVTNGRLLDQVTNLGEDNFTAEDRTFGRTAAFRIDRFVVAFRGYGDRQQLIDLAIGTEQRILGSIRRQLQSADKVRAAAARQ
ncbi:MAG TPA: DUF6599 family protein [Thermoanaerobaculia bacterium]|nr:DUF6599 family protein [Thermoanaerobaculia bacterium]